MREMKLFSVNFEDSGFRYYNFKFYLVTSAKLELIAWFCAGQT